MFGQIAIEVISMLHIYEPLPMDVYLKVGLSRDQLGSGIIKEVKVLAVCWIDRDSNGAKTQNVLA